MSHERHYETAVQVALGRNQFALAELLETAGYQDGHIKALAVFEKVLGRLDEDGEREAIAVLDVLAAARSDCQFRAHIEPRAGGFALVIDEALYHGAYTTYRSDMVRELIRIYASLPEFKRMEGGVLRAVRKSEQVLVDTDMHAFIDLRAYILQILRFLHALALAPGSMLEFLASSAVCASITRKNLENTVRELANQVPGDEERITLAAQAIKRHFHAGSLQKIIIDSLLRSRPGGQSVERSNAELQLVGSRSTLRELAFLQSLAPQIDRVEVAIRAIFKGNPCGHDETIAIPDEPFELSVPAPFGCRDRWDLTFVYEAIDRIAINACRPGDTALPSEEETIRRMLLAEHIRRWFHSTGKDAGIISVALRFSQTPSQETVIQ